MGFITPVITIVVTIFIFGLLVFIHELGHYIAARRLGVGVIEFAIGMGPKLKSWQGKHNTFSLRLLPFGGYVSMVGEYTEEIEEKDIGKIPLGEKKIWQRITIALAGPMMNIILGFLVMTIIVCSTQTASTTVASYKEGNTSSHQLLIGDVVKEIDGRKIRVFPDMSYKISADGIEPLSITVERDGNEIVLYGVEFPVSVENGMSFGSVDFKVREKEKSFVNIIYESFWQSVSTVYMTVDSLIDAVSGRYGFDAVSGPVGIGSEIGEVIGEAPSYGVKNTVMFILTIIVFISISLGIFNLLPVPVLDGGMIFLCIIEKIRGKPLDKKTEGMISSICMLALLAFAAVVMLKDIINIF